MGGITEKITEFIKDLLTGWITSNLDTMFTDVNTKVETIAAEVGKTPQNWNSGIFSMIKNLSDNVIVPIAGMIITFVLCYELISMIMEKNNMHDTDTFMFFKYIFKMWVAVYLVTHTFDIAMAIFDVANHVVSNAGGMITGSASIDVTEALKTLLETQIEDMGIGELLGLGLETMLVSLCLKIISVLITVILYGRMIEIYLYVSVAPIPFSTFTNREWGSIGNNYVKALLALGFQGFFMMVCVAIYAVLVNAITVADNLHTAKVDMTDGSSEVKGAKLYILNENQEVMESWTSGDQPHYVEKLPIGTYTLLEETAPKGYIVANKVTFEVKDTGDVQGAKMEDEQAMGKVILNKTDKDTKKPMKGVEFALCDSKGKVLETLVTDSAGHAESKNYPIATFKNGQYKKAITYILKETKTLDGYQLDETEHKIQFEYVNDRTPVIEYTLDLTNKKAPEKDTPETSENQGASTPVSHGSDATSVSSSPKTGDNTNIAIFVLVLAVSAGCLGTVVAVKRKRK